MKANGNVRTLVLPHGGTIDIPLPGGDAQFAMRPGSPLAGACPNLLPTVVICMLVGGVIAAGATAWYMSNR